jgi:hypothetical protein
MERQCKMYGGEETCILSFGEKPVSNADHLEGPGIAGRIILQWIFKKWNDRHGLD